MKELAIKPYLKLVLYVMLARAAVLFLAAGTVDYWQAWAFLAVNALGEFGTTNYLARRDPELLSRRLKMGAGSETRSNQRRISQLARAAVGGAIALSGLDHRHHWSHVSTTTSLLGDLAVAAGLVIVWLTFRANSFASQIVDVESDQRVVTNGPYALVRHPMYTGLMVMYTGMVLALGSWWGLCAVALFGVTLVIRLLDEEQFLAMNLAGYAEYLARVRHRLAPLVW